MTRTRSRCRLVLPAIAIAVLAVSSLTTRTGVEAWTTQYVGVSHGVSSASGAASDIGRSIAIAPDGSVFLAGFLQSSLITFGSDTAASAVMLLLVASGALVMFTARRRV